MCACVEKVRVMRVCMHSVYITTSMRILIGQEMNPRARVNNRNIDFSVVFSWPISSQCKKTRR